jgi:hypothetical protein
MTEKNYRGKKKEGSWQIPMNINLISQVFLSVIFTIYSQYGYHKNFWFHDGITNEMRSI